MLFAVSKRQDGEDDAAGRVKVSLGVIRPGEVVDSSSACDTGTG